MPTWRPEDLLLLVDVAEAGSFQAAADRHRLDRSAVSRRIAQLERMLGVRLLQRSTRSQSLTAAGHEMLRKGIELRALLADAQSTAEGFQTDPRGLLRITSASHFGQYVVLPAIHRFKRRHPQVDVELSLEDREVDLISEGYDLAFRIGHLDDSQLIARQIAPHPLRLVASPDFLAEHGVPASLHELSLLPAISYRSARLTVDRLHWMNTDGEITQQPMRVTLWLDRIDLIQEGALQGAGYAVLSAFMADQYLLTGSLIPLMPQLKLVDYAPVHVVYPHREMPMRARLFLAELQTNLLCERRPIDAKA